VSTGSRERALKEGRARCQLTLIPHAMPTGHKVP
jgi:hypothetical protein